MAVPAEVRLSLYNEALRHLGERRLVALSENVEKRRVLDDIWSADVVRYCLEQGEWTFATRTALATATPSIEPDFGFRFAFIKPDDFVRTMSIASDDRFGHVLTAREYADEAGLWFSDRDTLYVKFVSDAPDYGLDAARWPMTFRRYLSAQLAWDACERITGKDALMQKIDRVLQRNRTDARSKDAMAEGVKKAPTGSWVRARLW